MRRPLCACPSRPALVHPPPGRAHAYLVALPAVTEVKQLPLLRYESGESYRPIPLKIVLRWRFEPGGDRLEIRAATNPALKQVEPQPPAPSP
jgi:hypothetical protein